MFFLCKQDNKNYSIKREKTREKRKLSKIAYAPDIPNQSTTTRGEITGAMHIELTKCYTRTSNNDCETRKFKCLALDNVHALPIKYSCV